ncbi:L-serine ammonia-lyase, iron-sulfur-dependent subunit beta [Frisingicoccus sp.]|uniref:L-serine ammonia-lyase, iron-sulfur-dependent subunit beta n=1 Tax=Frisingicoccus sp. TaxID=1918627 RepID=UPI002604D96D|nr:L-serine ammonia-lyase, iron-sulfur-dependent subunit beta [Frisingicoccus sp.]MDD6233166.1 L-serine ammonia-lyase, iron-sulfur-dependent subunit beta [Frisingicoccus sp.]MDY4835211.1 L-serine ammonia-lyase, iron-sulfur-dependent subunit beta [Frisingicoccus sp.]MDY4921899.1 L-serine ammonia-lyase, iron-sulfur-dependent subunit beta [Frisingicoccus sp.]MDY5956270.1 L-serine ammonia-lyase, iron-sulfur-dependent subunit beta [Frisingicoccus sp.]
MNDISIFDIIGPNMIGPSSSHTAGALRIAHLAGKLAPSKILSVTFTLYGSFAWTYKGHGTDRALVGGILGFLPDDERIRDSFEIAAEQGLEYKFIENTVEKDLHPNTVDIILHCEQNTIISLRGESIGGGNALIRRLNGIDISLTGAYPTIIVHHKDQKGVLAYITTVCSGIDLNIAFMKVYRKAKGDSAYAIIEVDSDINPSITSVLKCHEAIIDATIVPAI